MESNYIFLQNINNMKMQQNDSINQKIKSGSKKDITNKPQNSCDFSASLEKEKSNISLEETDNYKKDLNYLLTKDLINNMKLISPIPKQNLPKKKPITEVLIKKRVESFDEQEEDFFPEEDCEEDDNDSDLEEIKEEIKAENNDNDNNKKEKEKEGNKTIIDVRMSINNPNDKNNLNSNKLSLNRTFSYNVNIKINKNKSKNKSQIVPFFESMSNFLKEQLKNDISFQSDINKSHNYVLKYIMEINNETNQINNDYNNQSMNNRSAYNESINFNINPNSIFGLYNQMSRNEISNMDNNDTNEIMINNKEDISLSFNGNNNQKEKLEKNKDKNKLNNIANLSKDFVNNCQPFYPKDKFIIINNNYENKSNYNYFFQTQNFFNNNINNKEFNFSENKNNIKNNFTNYKPN